MAAFWDCFWVLFWRYIGFQAGRRNRRFKCAYGTAPVVVGLVLYLFLSREGPLGFLGLLFS